MLGICRIGDTGIGYCSALPHIPLPITSTIIQGDATHIVEGSACAQFSVISMCSCGHIATAIQAAGTHISSGLGVHRFGDLSVTPLGGTNTIQSATRSFTGA